MAEDNKTQITTILCSNILCIHNSLYMDIGPYGVCKHPDLCDKPCYGGIDRVYQETCSKFEGAFTDEPVPTDPSQLADLGNTRLSLDPTEPLSPCPYCHEVPKMGYCFGEYFIAGRDEDCPGCGNTFTEMHSSDSLEAKVWNGYVKQVLEERDS